MEPSSRNHWSSSKNPRVVRVPRNFGGKYRHSKVTTLRGVKDRRIRLSAPTAIQLYDLQERLGLGQPSKAVDWLLDVAKNNIDSLPPLPGFVTQPTTTATDCIVAEYRGQLSEGVVNLLPPYSGLNTVWDPPNLSLTRFGGGFLL